MGWEWHNRQRTSKGTWARMERTERMQLRCTPLERELIRGRAYACQMDMSEYLLSLVQRDVIRERYDLPENGDSCEPTVDDSAQIVNAPERAQKPLTEPPRVDDPEPI